MAENEDCMDKIDPVDGHDKINSPVRIQNEDSLDFDLYGDLSVDLNQEITYPELKKLYEESQQTIKKFKAEIPADFKEKVKKGISIQEGSIIPCHFKLQEQESALLTMGCPKPYKM
ncbi:uncharacterized protein LOC111334329 isoform X2 [Stylophora pistillata]|uniref:uncharacterized protein LOC111334329 isoform X2 n=1 Tax=Stylophora pistillata TaxID=50429 RepID=UPI000C03EE66|nr:uncharacterized protein LOC111334329 isoform X2 [Stylophora pistillata]